MTRLHVLIRLTVVAGPTSALLGLGQGPAPAKLVDGAAGLNAAFGHVVALTGDTLAVGAWQDPVNGARAHGSAMVFARKGDAWIEEAKLTPPDGVARDYFGERIAADRDTIVVGVPQADVGGNADQGAVYVFVRTNGQWELQTKLTAPAGAAVDIFGKSVDISGDTIVVGAPGTDNSPADKVRTADGAAHVFTRAAGTWTARQKLIGTTSAFGTNVAIDGGTIAVSSVGAGNRSDAIHIFTSGSTGWTRETLIDAARDAAERPVMHSVFENLALSGSTLVVGGALRGGSSEGAAYVYVRERGTWTRQARLTPSDGTRGDNFGASLDISGDLVAVGALMGNQMKGVAYLFARQTTPTGVTWVETQRLAAPDGQPGDLFGADVAAGPGLAIVGADGQDLGKPNTNRGAAYVFGFARR